MEQEILSAKVKPDAYTKLWLKDELLMTLMKLTLGFLCWTVLTFWNTSSGYLTQTFNSQTLRGDLIIAFNNLIIVFNNFQSKQPSTQKR